MKVKRYLNKETVYLILITTSALFVSLLANTATINDLLTIFSVLFFIFATIFSYFYISLINTIWERIKETWIDKNANTPSDKRKIKKVEFEKENRDLSQKSILIIFFTLMGFILFCIRICLPIKNENMIEVSNRIDSLFQVMINENKNLQNNVLDEVVSLLQKQNEILLHIENVKNNIKENEKILKSLEDSQKKIISTANE